LKARIRWPYGQGIWPAFWMPGVPGRFRMKYARSLGENRLIMEIRGQKPTKLIRKFTWSWVSGVKRFQKGVRASKRSPRYRLPYLWDRVGAPDYV